MYVLYMSGPIVRYDIQHFSDFKSRCFYQIANKKSIQNVLFEMESANNE